MLEKHFTAKWQSPESLKVETVPLPIPYGSDAMGVLFERHALPAGLPYFVVKLSAQKALKMEKKI